MQLRIEDGSYYEAQQTIRAITNRYVYAKNYDAATELLYQSSMILTEYKKYDEASDLYLYLLEVFAMEGKQGQEFERDNLIKVEDFLNALPDSDSNISNLANETFKFSCKQCMNEVGFPKLNKLLGEKLYYSGVGKTIDQSQKFLVFSDDLSDAKLLAALYYDAYKKSGNANSFGEYFAQMATPYLAVRHASFAKEGLGIMIKRLTTDVTGKVRFTSVNEWTILEPQEKENSEELDNNCKLVNFIQLLVGTCEHSTSENSENFKGLFTRYRPILSQFEGLVDTINAIGQLYFNVTVEQKQNDFLRSMMGNLLGGATGN